MIARRLCAARSPMLAGALAAWLVTGAGADVGAQPERSQSRYSPEAEDFDSRSERHSGLWEQAAYPHRDRYMERINRAVDFMKRRDRDGDRAAIEKLREAIAMAEDEPAAYWLLGRIYRRDENWPRCVHNFDKVLAIDPGYQPPAEHLGRRSSGARVALDLGMAICQQRSGDFEAAVVHYKRILSRGVTGGSTEKRRLREQLYRRLGESYMALGRLREAIDALESATQQYQRNALAYYSLAVAYDRDERVAKARKALQSAFSFDHSLSKLSASSTWLAPASETFYYLGLAHATRGTNAWAVAYFRQYRRLAGDTAWARRAGEHLRNLAGEPIIAAKQIRVDGVALKPAAVLEAITRAREPLMKCMADAPGLLLEVRLTTLGRSGRKARKPKATRRGKRKTRNKRRNRRVKGQIVLDLDTLNIPLRNSRRRTPRPRAVVAGVRSTELYSFATTPAQTRKVRECVESTAAKIAIERPAGGPESYRRVTFPLIAVPTAADFSPPGRRPRSAPGTAIRE